MGESNSTQARSNYLICMRFIRVSTVPLFLTLFPPPDLLFIIYSFPSLFPSFSLLSISLLPPHLLFLLTSWTSPLSSSPPFLSSTMLLRTFKFSSTFCTLTPTYLPFSISCLHFPHFRILTLRFHICTMSNIKSRTSVVTVHS